MGDDKKMTLRLPPELHKKLSEFASAQNRSLHNLIITVLMEYAKQQKS